MAINRTQARNLLRPGLREIEGDRGLELTPDEEEAIIDVFVAAYQAGGMSQAATAAKKKAIEFAQLPLVLHKQQTRLAPLRSVSAAYKRSQIPHHFRNQEKDHESRQSPQDAARGAAQSPGPSWDGGAQAAGGIIITIGGGGNGTFGSYPHLANTASAANAALYQQQLAYHAMRNAYQPGGIVAGTLVGSNALTFGNSFVNATPDDPPKPLPVEIKAGELVAWRVWRAHGDELHSVFVWHVWKEGEVVTGDVDQGHGVHAWKTEQQARDYARNTFTDELAIGTVELWGKVIEHEEGYRAEFAQIKEIKESIPAYRHSQMVPLPAGSFVYQAGHGVEADFSAQLRPSALFGACAGGFLVGSAIATPPVFSIALMAIGLISALAGLVFYLDDA